MTNIAYLLVLGQRFVFASSRAAHTRLAGGFKCFHAYLPFSVDTHGSWKLPENKQRNRRECSKHADQLKLSKALSTKRRWKCTKDV
jgi:hypothetical protein